MLAKMARSAPSAAVRSVNGDDSRPRRQPGLPKRGENAKIRGGSEFIRRIPAQSINCVQDLEKDTIRPEVIAHNYWLAPTIKSKVTSRLHLA